MARQKIIVIGGNAGGITVASQLRRLNKDFEIIVFDKGHHISYSACGIPFYVGAILDKWEKLIVRTPTEFRGQDIQVWTMHEVTKIDTRSKTVEVHDLLSGNSFTEHWDKLLIATGSVHAQIDIPGADAEGVFGIDTIDSGVRLRKWIEENKPAKAVVVGGGYIGLEMVDAFSCELDIDVTVLERASQIMATLDEDMAILVTKHLEEQGIKVSTGESVLEFLTDGRRLKGVKTQTQMVDADLVITALGILPNTALAAEAGIETGVKGAIVVDPGMRTSVPDVWAVGDCIQSTNIITGGPMHIALGGPANKQARVAAFSMAGEDMALPGVLGSAVCKICGLEIARTGLLEREMKQADKPYVCGTIMSATMAPYFEGAGYMHVKLIADTRTERIVGAQTVGTGGSAVHIDTAIAAITAKFTLDDIVDLDLVYAPPISPVWDPIQQAARYIQSMIRKKN